MKNLVVFFFTFFISNVLLSQSAIIKGNINNEDGTVSEFANVLLYNANDSVYHKGAITDFNGTYTFEKISIGSYYLIASQVGYSTLSSAVFNINVDDQIMEITPMVFKAGVALDEVVVRAQKPLIELEADKIIVNVANSSVSTGDNALEILQKAPGVTVDRDNNVALKGKQGVMVLLDGKNQYLTGDQLSQLLENMPANSIEKIEIIHNPSSKYEAAGNAGIINIKLKKNENLGYNGTANLGLGHGKYAKGNAGLSLNYRGEKINVFGNYDYGYWKGFNDIILDRTVPFESGFTDFHQTSTFINKSHSNNFKTGLDYSLSDKTTIGVLARGSFGNRDGSNTNATFITGEKPQEFDRSTTESLDNGAWNQLSGNLNIKHQFSESSDINFDLDYSNYDQSSGDAYDNYFFDEAMNPVMAPFFLRNDNGVDVKIFAAKLDFTKSLSSGWNLEAGAKVSDVLTNNKTLFEQQTNSEWVVDNSLTNTFEYDEQIYAGYANFSKTFGKTNVKGGLRLEHTMSQGESITLDELVSREYTELFPSASVSHTIGEKHSLSFSYSRRLDRPSYRNLNPFIEFLDQFTFQKGNPFLKPQFTNSFGLNYGLGRSLFISANYSRTTDAMTQVLEQNDLTQQTFQTTVNLDKFDNYSLNVTAPVILKEWWTTRLSFTGFINDFESQFSNGNVDNDQASYQVNVSNEFSINNDVNAELSGWYRSGSAYGIFNTKPMYSIDLGFSWKVMDGAGRVKVSAKDVFGTMKNEVTVDQGSINLTAKSNWESQRVNVAFSYNFGNQKVQGARIRKTANSEEESRVSSGYQ